MQEQSVQQALEIPATETEEIARRVSPRFLPMGRESYWKGCYTLPSAAWYSVIIAGPKVSIIASFCEVYFYDPMLPVSFFESFLWLFRWEYVKSSNTEGCHRKLDESETVIRTGFAFVKFMANSHHMSLEPKHSIHSTQHHRRVFSRASQPIKLTHTLTITLSTAPLIRDKL